MKRPDLRHVDAVSDGAKWAVNGAAILIFLALISGFVLTSCGHARPPSPRTATSAHVTPPPTLATARHTREAP